MQSAHDYFERRLLGKFGVWIDRDATAVVGHRHEPIGLHRHLDESGVSRKRLVHGIVDDFGEQVMERLFVGSSDVHAGPATYRLEPFQNLDMMGGITGIATADRLGAAFLGGKASWR